MSNLRQGILRAVRLLPDVVKIGMETEIGTEAEIETEIEAEIETKTEVEPALPAFPGEEQVLNEKPPAPVPDPLQELTDRIMELQSGAAAAESVKKQLTSRIASLEAELVKVKEDVARKERELTASVEVAREQARAEGKTKGHAEGLESGRQASLVQARSEVTEEYRKKFADLMGLLEKIPVKLEENFAGLVALNQPRMLRLWQEMLKKMLQREMTLAPEAVLDVLGDVLARLSDKNHLLIYVCPGDMALLEAGLQEEFGDFLRGVRHLELKSDANVDKGSCIVETNLGIYDARWRTQLDQVETVIEALLQKLGKTPTPSLPHPRRKRTGNGAAESALPGTAFFYDY